MIPRNEMIPRVAKWGPQDYCAALVITIASLIAMTGCSRPATNQTPTTPQPAEPQVRSSADVVSLAGTGTMMSSVDAGEALVLLNIEPGYHVNANPATYPYLIATEVIAAKTEGIEVGKPIYPPAKQQKFQFADEPLAVYEGQVEVKLALKVTGKGSHSLPIQVRVQACDHEKCFPPATLDTNVSVEAK